MFLRQNFKKGGLAYKQRKIILLKRENNPCGISNCSVYLYQVREGKQKGKTEGSTRTTFFTSYRLKDQIAKKIAVPVEESVEDTTKKDVISAEIPTLLFYEKISAGQETGSDVRIAWAVEIREEDLPVVPLCIRPDVRRLVQECSRRMSGREESKDRRTTDAALWDKISSTGSHSMNLTDLYDLSDRGKKAPRIKKVDLTESTAARVKAGEITKEEGSDILMDAFNQEMEKDTN